MVKKATIDNRITSLATLTSKIVRGQSLSVPVLITTALLALGACSDEAKTSAPASLPQGATGAAQNPTGAAQVPTGTLTVAEADSAAGEQHFNQNCSPCHQIGGVGRPGLAPSIRNRDFLAIASDDFIRATIAGGRVGTAMVPRPDLSHEVVTEIIAYLRSLEVPNPSRLKLDPARKSVGDVSRGGEQFSLYCAYCHGQKGEGYVAGGPGPGIGMSSFLAIASDDYIFQTVKQGRVGTAMRSFAGSEGLANLNDQDINDIIVWLRRPQ